MEGFIIRSRLRLGDEIYGFVLEMHFDFERGAFSVALHLWYGMGCKWDIVHFACIYFLVDIPKT